MVPSKTSTKHKSIRPNRLQLSSYVGPYRSLQGESLNFLKRVEIRRNKYHITYHSTPNLTETVLRGAPVYL